MNGTPGQSILERVPLFVGLAREQYELLESHCYRRRYPIGEKIVRRLEPGYTMYVVLEGRAEVTSQDELGNTIHLATRGPGEHFGEMSMLDGELRSADVTTIEPCEFLILDRDGFLECLKKSPELARRVIASLCRRLREADTARSDSRPAMERMALVLLELADQYGRPHGEPEKGLVLVRLPMSREDLASRIRVKRETASRLLADLRKNGVLRIQGRREILVSRRKLEKLAGL